MELDKDLLAKHDEPKIYSPETCCLIPKTANLLLSTLDKATMRKSKGRNSWEFYGHTEGVHTRACVSYNKDIVAEAIVSYKISKLYEINRILERSSCEERVYSGIAKLIEIYYNKSSLAKQKVLNGLNKG